MFQRYRQKQAVLGSGPGPIVQQLLTREDGDPVHLLWTFGVRPHGGWAVLQWWGVGLPSGSDPETIQGIDTRYWPTALGHALIPL